MSEEKQEGFIFTPKVEEEGLIKEFPGLDAQADELDTEEKTSSIKTPEELQKINEEIKAEIEAEEKNEGAIGGAVEGAVDDTAEDLNKKTYVKITSTLYIKPAGTEKNKEGEDVKLYKVLNPETNVVEKRPLTDGEKHEILVRELKESHIKFHPIKNATKTVGTTTIESSIGRKRLVKNKEIQTNITTHQFGADYRKARKRKNKIQRDSRKSARKK